MQNLIKSRRHPLSPSEPGSRISRRLSQPGGTRTFEIRGIPIDVDVQGDGLPILFVHGFPLDRTMWRPLTGLLTGHYRICPDLRTVAHRLGDTAPRGMQEMADDLATLLDQLELDRAVICGLSMGGYLAFEMVRRYAERIRALVLCNTRAEADTDEGRANRDALAALARERGSAVVAEQMLPKLIARESLVGLPEVVEHVRAMIDRNNADGIADALIAMKHRPDSTPQLAQIAVPTLVITGDDDRIMPSEHSRRMAAAISGARFVVIPGSGHLSPLEQPVSVSRVLGEFLESIH